METKNTLTPDTKYVVVDTHTKLVVYSTTYANRKRARAVADRKDNAYGAVRFVCKFA